MDMQSLDFDTLMQEFDPASENPKQLTSADLFIMADVSYDKDNKPLHVGLRYIANRLRRFETAPKEQPETKLFYQSPDETDDDKDHGYYWWDGEQKLDPEVCQTLNTYYPTMEAAYAALGEEIIETEERVAGLWR